MNSSFALWRRLTDASSPLAVKQTLTYYLSFIALGMTTASLGPTLLGLASQTGSELSQISFLFTARAGGYLVGSFIGGRLFDRLPAHRTMAAATLLISALLALVPGIPLLWLLTGVLLAVGFMEAVVDVGANTLIVWVHRDRVGPYMNGLHSFFAIGGFLSPILVAQVIILTGNIGWSYWMLALVLLPVALRLFPLPNPEPIVSVEQHASVRPNALLLVLVIAIFVALSGVENSFAGWIFTYAVKTNLANETTAAYLNAAFWGAFMFSRLASIPLAARVRPRVMIMADLMFALAGVAVVLLMPSSEIALWVGTILFGLGIAAAFPTMLTFAGRHMTITGAATGWFFVGASIGSMTLPALIGQLFESVSPTSVLWVIGIALVTALGVFGLILLYLKRAERIMKVQ